jgi:hypothetical protein
MKMAKAILLRIVTDSIMTWHTRNLCLFSILLTGSYNTMGTLVLDLWKSAEQSFFCMFLMTSRDQQHKPRQKTNWIPVVLCLPLICNGSKAAGSMVLSKLFLQASGGNPIP